MNASCIFANPHMPQFRFFFFLFLRFYTNYSLAETGEPASFGFLWFIVSQFLRVVYEVLIVESFSEMEDTVPGAATIQANIG